MVVAAAQRLTDGLSCLLWSTQCGIDIRRDHQRVRDWFAGRRVPPWSTLPPASYPILWPFLGWLSVDGMLALWVVTSVLALAWLAVIAVRESGACTRTEWVFMAVLPLAMYAARATIVNGQYALHILPPLITAVLLIERRRPGWRRDLGAAALVLIALIKPSVTAPFVLMVALSGDRPAERLRPLALVVAGYAALVILAGVFRDAGLADLWRTWLAGSVEQAARQYGGRGAYGSLHHWLGALRLERLNGAASLLALAALGAFVRRYRHADVWILLGVTGVVARVWTYHRIYDDMLILLPMIALFRLWTRGGDRTAAVVLGVVWVGALAPARLFEPASPWVFGIMLVEQLTWVLALSYLAWRARGPRAAMPALAATPQPA
jgi:hypothetical protein